MRKNQSFRLFFLTLFFIMALAGAAFAGAQDFLLVNNTGYPIYKINVSPASTDDWEEDILGSQILNNGETLRVLFGDGKQRYWDIQAVFKDGSGIAWYDIDLLSVRRITLNGDGTASLR